jgi:hypothetical protein
MRLGPPSREGGKATTKVVSMSGQQVHEIEVSDELLSLEAEELHREVVKLIPSRR